MALTRLSTGLFSSDSASVNLNIDAGTLYVDATNNRVGIGTSSPSAKLHIYESGTGDGTLRVGNAQGGNTTDIGKQGSAGYGATSAGDAFVYTSAVNLSLMADGASSAIKFSTGGNTERMRISSDGHVLPGANNTYDLGSSAKGWRNIYTNDLNLSNMPSEGEDIEGNPYTREGNEVDGTNGSWTIQEGADDLFLINRRNGRKYRFNLTEVTD